MGWAALFLMFIAVAAQLKRRTYQARIYLTLCFICDGDLLTIALVKHAVTNGSRDMMQLAQDIGQFAQWIVGVA